MLLIKAIISILGLLLVVSTVVKHIHVKILTHFHSYLNTSAALL